MDPKIRGIVAYITIIGWIIALVTNNPKAEQTTYHLRQALGLHLIFFVGGFVFWIPIIGWALFLGILALAIIGLISAIEGTRKPVPYLGKHFQEWFKGL